MWVRRDASLLLSSAFTRARVRRRQTKEGEHGGNLKQKGFSLKRKAVIVLIFFPNKSDGGE